MTKAPFPVFGLILAGGTSSRMRRDKATLEYLGKSQLDRAFELMSRHVPKTFVSVRADQAADSRRAQRPLLLDSVGGGGPIVGIRSALAAYPEAAWLVIACDLPFLSDAVLAHLMSARDAAQMATAYRSARDGLPEPLCAIWEPAAAAALQVFQAGGRSCPRQFLIETRAKLLEPLDPRALDNINTPEEYVEALKSLESPSAPRRLQIKIQYYALLREQAGRSEESLDTAAPTPALLYAEIKARHGFSLGREQLKVAVNGEFSDWERTLAAGDSVVFIPPVAGG